MSIQIKRTILENNKTKVAVTYVVKDNTKYVVYCNGVSDQPIVYLKSLVQAEAISRDATDRDVIQFLSDKFIRIPNVENNIDKDRVVILCGATLIVNGNACTASELLEAA